MDGYSTGVNSHRSGYFVCSTGDASTETIAKYIAEQGQKRAYIHRTEDPMVLRSIDNKLSSWEVEVAAVIQSMKLAD